MMERRRGYRSIHNAIVEKGRVHAHDMLDVGEVRTVVGDIAEGDLAAGRLVSPFDLTFAEGYGYYLVYEPQSLTRPKNAAFRSFIFEEAADSGSSPGECR